MCESYHFAPLNLVNLEYAYHLPLIDIPLLYPYCMASFTVHLLIDNLRPHPEPQILPEYS
jgi:hypothetical protein